jgi:hypothetical protein
MTFGRFVGSIGKLGQKQRQLAVAAINHQNDLKEIYFKI